jgi:predicted amidophosphoribosyltransferase
MMGLIKRRSFLLSAAEMSSKERASLIPRLFSLDSKFDIRGKKLLLVDDVMTTGLSILTCAKLLLDFGAEPSLYAVARRPKLRAIRPFLASERRMGENSSMKGIRG